MVPQHQHSVWADLVSDFKNVNIGEKLRSVFGCACPLKADAQNFRIVKRRPVAKHVGDKFGPLKSERIVIHCAA